MADPFVAEVRRFPFSFAPTGWALCDGQIMPISQNTALFSLLGTTYGGDGRSTFALPNLQGCVPMHPGQGPGLSLHDLGALGGTETLALLESEIAAHSPTVGAANGNLFIPAANATQVQMHGVAIQPTGSGQPHNNLQPYLTLNFCIALQGV